MLKKMSNVLLLVALAATSFAPGCVENVSGPTVIREDVVPMEESESEMVDQSGSKDLLPSLSANWDFTGGPVTGSGNNEQLLEFWYGTTELQVYATVTSGNDVLMEIQMATGFPNYPVWVTVQSRMIKKSSHYQTIPPATWATGARFRVKVTKAANDTYKVKYAGRVF